jgi:DNA-binding HxlR family transcriptional regulator
MKSYEQYCGLALALDRVGERWTLLIVRELLSGPKRFSDLASGLPGVPTNLLAGRLRTLEANGLLERQTLPPPAASAVYVLTELGEGLAEPVHALVRWGGHFMQRRSRRQAFRPHWLGLALEALLSDAPWPKTPLSLMIELPEGNVAFRFEPDGKRLAFHDAQDPDARMRGAAKIILGLAAGELDWASALASGLDIAGSAAAVNAVRSVFTKRVRPARADVRKS